MILTYELLAKFRNARFGNNILTFEDLHKERSITLKVRTSKGIEEKEYHIWIARKNKREYLLLDDELKDLPLKIHKTEIIKEGISIYHRVKEHKHIGFMPERCFDFRELVDNLAEGLHSNKHHQKLLWLVAVASYLQRVNARICTNIEFGKDSTFITLGYLTNQCAVFDKPRTMAKLEYGLINRVLMVNELMPSNEEQRNSIKDFLLSVGGLSPTYHKRTRESKGTKEVYDLSDFSLVICYNTLSEISEKDKENYFDVSFGNNVKLKFMPFLLKGKIDISQFRENKQEYNLESDEYILRLARTIEWYKQNFKQELKPYALDLLNINLPERFKATFLNIVDCINLYVKDDIEFKWFVSELLNCYYAYDRMVKGNNRIEDFEHKGIELKQSLPDGHLEPEIVDLSQEVITPIDFIRQYGNSGKISIDLFLNQYPEDILNKLMREGVIFRVNSSEIKILE